jgi:hypothetical protein
VCVGCIVGFVVCFIMSCLAIVLKMGLESVGKCVNCMRVLGKR